MFSWLNDLIEALLEGLGDLLEGLGESISNTIWNTMLTWIYTTVFGAVSDFFTSINGMGSQIFDLPWVSACVRLFYLLGWALFVVGAVVAVFDVAIEYQTGRANIKACAINIIKGFMAASLVCVVPVELYKFCISLQNTFAHDVISLYIGTHSLNLSEICLSVLNEIFNVAMNGTPGTSNALLMIVYLLAFAYCVVKVFFQNLTRGGILLVQIAVGSLYMFSVPRGYDDGFNQWIKQVVALCLTAFLQTTLLYLGLLTMDTSILLALGIMFAGNEVPRICQQFGLDSSVKINVSNIVHNTTTAVSLVRTAKNMSA